MLRLVLLSIVVVVLWIAILPYMMPSKPKNKYSYSDEELRNKAMQVGMQSIPNDYKKFIALVQTPDNLISKEKVALGKKLYFDTILSKDRTIRCASCHMLSKDPHNQQQFLDNITHPNSKTDCMVCHIKDQSGSDRLSTAIGVKGKTDPYHRNTLTILNSTLAKYQLWDASSKNSLQSIAKMIQDPYKMDLTPKEAITRLNNSPTYKQAFQKVFKDGITFLNIQKAIDAYLKTLLTRSAYDRFLDGDDSAMTPLAKQGFIDFIELGCKGCHTGITVGGQTIQKFPVRNYNHIIDVTGSFRKEYRGFDMAKFDFNFKQYQEFPFENKGGFMGKDSQKYFRVPILRNITKTSPYFHNGSVFDLREAIYIMAKYQLSTELTEEQIDEIEAFLRSLEGKPVIFKELEQ